MIKWYRLIIRLRCGTTNLDMLIVSWPSYFFNCFCSRQYLLILESQPDFHQNVKKASRFSKDPSASPSGTPRSHFPVGFLRGIRYPKVSVLVGRCLHSSPLSLVSVQCLQLSMATCGCWSRTRPLLHVPWCIVQVHRLSTTVGFASFAN